ncbi:hypothetical protein [Paenibacillus tianjinensis]|uniref:Uncharacterized protein n=1 Tax=Paenibacillus tianjinensis TaxID=2810347 RepID=A0ABX7L8P9_9BACL|nr:hypothetical protein [Paenibacillus tianjinensis]QSF42805.1 hypothetical protein JRJ22_15985 [Paenibacillus tianjinensis]
MEVLYHKGTVISLFPVPGGTDSTVIGVLPKGEWLEQSQAMFGHVDNVYFAVYLSHQYELIERRCRIKRLFLTRRLYLRWNISPPAEIS